LEDVQAGVPVEVEPVEPVASFDVERSYTGTIVARRTSELAFERSAKVISMLVDQGDPVREGQTLAVLDSRHLRVKHRQIEAQRDEAAAVLAELKAGPRAQTVAAARATVEDAQAQVELQRRVHRRTTELVKDYATSKETFDESELGLRSADARLTVARQQLEELEAGTRLERIDAQAAVVAQLDEQLADLAIEIEDSTLLAPFDGRVAARHVDEGTVVSPANPVLTIVEAGHLEAHVGLPVDALSERMKGDEMEVTVGDRNWPAVFDRTLPQVDPATRTRIVIFGLGADAADHIVPGQIVRVALRRSLPTDGFWMPTSALVRSVRGLWAAYVVEPDSSGRDIVRRRDVEVLHADGERTLVRGTLRRGDRVITSGTHRVVPGQVVSPQ
jgi:RND family efflux transporter MFP subunit